MAHLNGPTPVSGMVERALSFDGVDDYVEVTHPMDGSLGLGTGDFSIDAWIKTNRRSGIQVLVDKRDEGSSVQGFSLYLSNGELGFQLADGVGPTFCTSNPTTASCTNYGSNTLLITASALALFKALTKRDLE